MNLDILALPSIQVIFVLKRHIPCNVIILRCLPREIPKIPTDSWIKGWY